MDLNAYRKRDDWIYVSRIQAQQTENLADLIRSRPEESDYDLKTQGWWIRRNSACHTLILLAGCEPYDGRQWWRQTGTWTRSGRTA